MLIEFINSILFQFVYNILNYDIVSFLILKKDTMYWFNIYNFIYYLLYAWVKTWLLKLYFYIVKIFVVFIYGNILNNKLYKKWINYLFIFKNRKKSKSWTRLYLEKKIYRAFLSYYRIVYRFYYINYFLFLLYFISFIIFILMWKRRYTYQRIDFIIIY